MFKFVVALALVAVAFGSPVVDEFESFKAQFGKTYHSTSEEAVRRDIFLFNKAEVEAHNARHAAGLESYTVGLNEFSDMTQEEFTAAYTTKIHEQTERNEVFLSTENLADEVDWRSKGAVTPVKNQGQCGSCWSFSTTGSVEGAVQIATGKLIELSEQQLMDCSTKEGDHSCEGGLMDNAFKYIIQNGGLDTEQDYFYKARDEKCDASKAATKAATITGFTDVPQSEEQLMAAINKGPVSIAIEADQRGFQTYKSGVFTGPCGTRLDHGVLAVGYGSEGGKDYWLVKNSWGESWGDEGYIKIERGSDLCGITQVASYPTGASIPSETPAVEELSLNLGALPAANGPHYEDPGSTNTCQSGEIAVQITGVSGNFCSPSCTSGPCPTDVPDGATAKPECVLEKPGTSKPSNCALICQPGDDAACPDKATCKPIATVGICTYDS